MQNFWTEIICSVKKVVILQEDVGLVFPFIMLT